MPHQRIRGRRFGFDIHGARDADLERLKEFFDTPEISVAVVAWESGKHSIHPHWQGYFEYRLFEELDNPMLDPALKKELEDDEKNEEKMKNYDEHAPLAFMRELLGHPNFKIWRATGTPASNLNYCYAVDKPHEIGWIRYAKGHQPPERYDPTPVDELVEWSTHPRPFQRTIFDIIKTKPDRRWIYYFWEPDGNTGKTIISEILHVFHGAIITGGSASDMKHAIARWREIAGVNPPIIICDVARSDHLSHESYKGLESIKNGLFFTSKYDAGMVHASNKPHVIVFANEAPDPTLFSMDRWKIFKINNKTHTATEEF